MSDPFKIDGPALVSFSGGRTSAYMLWRILQAHGGTLPADVRVTFANTGKETPQTLDFVRDCGDRWGVDIVWLQYKEADETKDRWEIVTHETAARKGEPFKALIDRKGYLPNPVTRFCTSELKIRVMRDFCRSLGWDNWTNVIGLRADEPARVARARVARARVNRDAWENAMPLATAGITKSDVQEFWARQNFDLSLLNIGGTTPAGNCDLCFLKGAATIAGLIRANPDLADWWAEAEAATRASKPDGARFRKDRMGYEAMKLAVLQQQNFDFPDENRIDCFCMDDAA
jgi:3'-phosphoadenosine 5'-phosphosulfate sulfotransferase (PAPS reductase)/FAD synthetase